jgi:hypothetical protein
LLLAKGVDANAEDGLGRTPELCRCKSSRGRPATLAGGAEKRVVSSAAFPAGSTRLPAGTGLESIYALSYMDKLKNLAFYLFFACIRQPPLIKIALRYE